MSVTVYEKLDSRKPETGDSPADTLDYFMVSTGADIDDDQTNLAALVAAAPTTWRGLVRKTVSLGTNRGAGIWEGSAKYGATDQTPQEAGEFRVSFDTTGGTAHFTVGRIDNQVYTAAGITAGATGKLIGVTEDSVEGVDVTIPVFQFQETWTFADSEIDDAYLDTLFRITGTVNDNDFRHMGPGECLFLGASGQARPDKTTPSIRVWDLTFKFAGSPLEENIEVGDGIIVTVKGGWDYLWFRYIREVIEGSDPKMMGQKILSAHVSRVYHDTDFANLEIGT